MPTPHPHRPPVSAPARARASADSLPPALQRIVASRRAEPPDLTQRRQQLLQALTAQVAVAPPTVKALLVAARALVASTRRGAAPRGDLASGFAQALTDYLRDEHAPKTPPPLVRDVARFIRAQFVATGQGALLDLAHEARERAVAARGAQAKQAALTAIQHQVRRSSLR